MFFCDELFFAHVSVLRQAYCLLSVLHDCETLQFTRLHFRSDLTRRRIANALRASFFIVCLDLCGKAQLCSRGTTWPNKQGTSGNTVSPELCAQGAHLRDPATSDTSETTLKTHIWMRHSVKRHLRVSVLCLWWTLVILITQMVLNIFHWTVSSAVRTLP